VEGDAASKQLSELAEGLALLKSTAQGEAVAADVEKQLAALADGVERLSAAASARANSRPEVTLSDVRSRMLSESAAGPRAKELSEIPAKPFAIFCEFDELCLSGEVEKVLLGADAPVDRDARLAALQALKLSLEDASDRLRTAGVVLRTAFIDFVETCAVHRVRVCILSRGLKPLIRSLLRDEGIGHVEVIAHDMYVDREAGNAWRISFRDDSPTGHDKSESMRRALATPGVPRSAVVLVGRTACDFGPVLNGHVSCVCTPSDSELATLCSDADVRTRSFDGWDGLSSSLFA